MTVEQLIAELRGLPQQLPVRVLMSAVYVPEVDELIWFDESEAQAVDTVRAAGGWVMIEGA